MRAVLCGLETDGANGKVPRWECFVESPCRVMDGAGHIVQAAGKHNVEVSGDGLDGSHPQALGIKGEEQLHPGDLLPVGLHLDGHAKGVPHLDTRWGDDKPYIHHLLGVHQGLQESDDVVGLGVGEADWTHPSHQVRRWRLVELDAIVEGDGLP